MKEKARERGVYKGEVWKKESREREREMYNTRGDERKMTERERECVCIVYRG